VSDSAVWRAARYPKHRTLERVRGDERNADRSTIREACDYSLIWVSP
jgi:hypothetical protein